MESTMIDIVVFYVASAAAVGGAFMMIWQRNPVASALFLILSLLSQAVLYILLDAVFLGALLVIIYAGAIVTLVLFVIMLLNLRGEQFVDQSSGLKRYLKLITAGLVGAELVYIIAKTSAVKMKFSALTESLAGFGDVKPVAELLYSKYVYGFELTSILLLAAIVGAVVLAQTKDEPQAGSDA